MIYDKPYIDEDGNIVVIVRDDNGNVIGSNISVPEIKED